MAVAFRLAAAIAVPSLPAPDGLMVGYYNDKCSNVETIVKDTVKSFLDDDITKGPALVRLIFHDCFVRGCDGSILLDQSSANPEPERASGANIGIKALEVIDAIKANVENVCPGIVSCADIVVFAAREASKYLSNGGIDFAVPAGRLDGVVSRASEADQYLPDSKSDVPALIAGFATKGFTPEELVILSGAHSVGRAHCSSFSDRLTAPSGEINLNYRDNVLRKGCGSPPANPTLANNIRDINASTLGNLTSYVVPAIGGDYLDNSYYKNNLKNVVLFHSDWALVGNSATLAHVHEYADNGTLWNLDFADALVKLSKLPMPTGSVGQIRKTCRSIDY
ncbi:hypothetical protein ABZP36_017067 [Zizania latifolia]